GPVGLGGSHGRPWAATRRSRAFSKLPTSSAPPSPPLHSGEREKVQRLWRGRSLECSGSRRCIGGKRQRVLARLSRHGCADIQKEESFGRDRERNVSVLIGP